MMSKRVALLLLGWIVFAIGFSVSTLSQASSVITTSIDCHQTLHSNSSVTEQTHHVHQQVECETIKPHACDHCLQLHCQNITLAQAFEDILPVQVQPLMKPDYRHLVSKPNWQQSVLLRPPSFLS